MMDIRKLTETMSIYSKNIGITSFSLSGQNFSPYQTFTDSGLLPLIVKRGNEILEHSKLGMLSNGLGMALKSDSQSLTGHTVVIEDRVHNPAVTLLILAEVIHIQYDLSPISGSNITVGLDGMLDTYRLEEINQLETSGVPNVFFKAAISDKAIQI